MKQTGRHGAHAPVHERVAAPPRLKRHISAGERRRIHLPAAITVAAAAAVILLSISLIGTADAREYRGYISQASQCMEEGNYDSALSYLRKAAAIDGSNECVLMMADCYQAQQNYEKALSALGMAQSPNEEVRGRINEIERLRADALAAKKLSVAGRLVAPDTRVLVLDWAELEGGLPEELLQLRSLDNLSVANAALSDISAISELSGLASLDLSGNQVSDLTPLSSLTGLRTLYLDENPITDFTPLLGLTKLTTLSIRGIDIDASMLERLSSALPSCAIYSDNSPEDAVDITIGGISFKSDVRELDLSGKGIRDISALAECKNLVELNLRGNMISDLSPIMNIPGLEWLDVSYNELADINPLMGMGTLRTVYAVGNRISGTSSVGEMSALTELDLSENPIDDFSGLKKLRNLKVLMLRSTGADDEGLSYLEYLSSLLRLELDGNPDISGDGVASFQTAVPGCVVIHSQLVYTVDIGGVTVRTDAEELDIGRTGASDLSVLASMGCLKKADLSGNGISNIYIFQYSGSRFTLKELDLSDNALEDITPVSWLRSLETLDLSGNNISSVQALMDLSNLRTLYIGDNPIPEEQLQLLCDTLKECQIYY